MSNSITFPTDALVGSIGDLARTQGAGTEVPEEFYFATGLTMLGHAVGTGLTLDVGIAVEPRLYTVLLGESYSVKKSTAMKKTITSRTLSEASKDWSYACERLEVIRAQ